MSSFQPKHTRQSQTLHFWRSWKRWNTHTHTKKKIKWSLLINSHGRTGVQNKRFIPIQADNTKCTYSTVLMINVLNVFYCKWKYGTLPDRFWIDFVLKQVHNSARNNNNKNSKCTQKALTPPEKTKDDTFVKLSNYMYYRTRN